MAANPPNSPCEAPLASDEEYEEVEEVEEIEEVEEFEEIEEEEEEEEEDPEEAAEGSEEKPNAAEETKVEIFPAQETKKWPGWPGDNVFRLVVPVVKVGGLIGRKGEVIKKLCEETKANVRILDAPARTVDRVVVITGKEEPEADTSPAMDAVLRVFKRVNEFPDCVDGGTNQSSAAPVLSSARLIVAESQATSLIGKKGQVIKSIQESSGALARILTGDELPRYVAADERIVDIQGESCKVLKALELILAHLRKFLVDHSVLPLFDKNYHTLVSPLAQNHREDAKGDQAAKVTNHSAEQSMLANNYNILRKRDYPHSSEFNLDSQISQTELSFYGLDSQSERRTSKIGRTGATFVTQITQTMQIPLVYAEDIIGIHGAKIAYIRQTSGAAITVEETRGYLEDEIIVEIKGTSSQVHAAQDLIQEFMAHHGEPEASRLASLDGSLRSTYSQLPSAGDSTSFNTAGHDLSDYSRLSAYRGFRS